MWSYKRSDLFDLCAINLVTRLMKSIKQLASLGQDICYGDYKGHLEFTNINASARRN